MLQLLSDCVETVLVQRGLPCLQTGNTVYPNHVSGKYVPVAAAFPFPTFSFNLKAIPPVKLGPVGSRLPPPPKRRKGQDIKDPTEIMSGKPRLLIARTEHSKRFFSLFSF